MVENRWEGFDILGKKKADSGKVTPDSTREEKDAAFQKVIDYAESLGIKVDTDSVHFNNTNLVIYGMSLIEQYRKGLK